MPKCRNCGLETMRTEDWACQWCGYPLVSNSYKKVPKTFRQLHVEPVTYEETHEEEAPHPRVEPPPPRPVQREAETPRKPAAQKVELKPEPAVEVKAQQPAPEPAVEETPEQASKPVVERSPEPPVEQDSAPVVERGSEPAEEKPHETPPAIAPEPPVAASVLTPEIELTVEGLLNLYAAEGVAADAKLANKILKIKGSVGRVEVKEALGIYYVNLIGIDRKTLQGVRCVFSQVKAAALAGLVIGQGVTIVGRYDGSVIDARMKDCVLVEK